MAHVCCLLSPGTAEIDVLPTATSPYAVLEQGPFHAEHLAAGWTLFWSSSSYQFSQVNDLATNIAKQLVKGDACLVHPCCQQQMLRDLLRSKRLKTSKHPAHSKCNGRYAGNVSCASEHNASSTATGQRSLEGRYLDATGSTSCLNNQREISACHAFNAACTGQSSSSSAPSSSALASSDSRDNGAAAAGSLPAWEALPSGIITHVASFLQSSVIAVMPMYSTCRAWQRAVLEDDQLLLGITHKLNANKPFKPQHQLMQVTAKHRQPALLERAAKLGNVSALVTRARLLDACGEQQEALCCWRRAAKAGHVEGQLVTGLALYKGTYGATQDAEDAYLWLLKAIKQVQQHKQQGSNTANQGDRSAEDKHASRNPLCQAECDMCELQQRVLSQAGLLLGYLTFDGEGTRTDRQEAVRFFKMAASAGNLEAEKTLGWIFNTGQY